MWGPGFSHLPSSPLRLGRKASSAELRHELPTGVAAVNSKDRTRHRNRQHRRLLPLPSGMSRPPSPDKRKGRGRKKEGQKGATRTYGHSGPGWSPRKPFSVAQPQTSRRLSGQAAHAGGGVGHTPAVAAILLPQGERDLPLPPLQWAERDGEDGAPPQFPHGREATFWQIFNRSAVYVKRLLQ